MMRGLVPAVLLAVAVLSAPAALAQVPKFTIVSVSTDPPGPLPPGATFKVKVVVRNDGDTIPAGRRFEFGFSTPDALTIGTPTGTPALFFGFCPGATPTRIICQCSAAWEKGQTMEVEAEVSIGSSARGAVTLTFQVSSGAVSDSTSVAIQISAAGAPDVSLKITPKSVSSFQVSPQIGAIVKLADTKTAKPGETVVFEVEVSNGGTAPTTPPLVVSVVLQQGAWGPSSSVAGLNCSDFVFTPTTGLATHSSNRIVPPQSAITLCLAVKVESVPAVTTVSAGVSAGGDLNAGNNSTTLPSTSFTIVASPAAAPVNATQPAPTSGR